MPLIKSAIKKMRQDAKRTVRNNRTRKSVKESVRNFTDAVAEGKPANELTELLRKAYKSLDTAAKKNLIHDKNAARKKSALAKQMPTAK